MVAGLVVRHCLMRILRRGELFCCILHFQYEVLLSYDINSNTHDLSSFQSFYTADIVYILLDERGGIIFAAISIISNIRLAFGKNSEFQEENSIVM